MNIRKTISAIIALCLILTRAGCGAPTNASTASDLPQSTPEVAPVVPETPEETPEPPSTEPDPVVNVMVLNGTTGFGAAKLISDYAAVDADVTAYNFSVETDASNVTAALVNGSCDIAALPTNAAASLYNKTQGGVQIIALNTRGVLYVLTNGDLGIATLADLEGKTVYCPAQNPAFIFSALLSKAGVNATVDTTYAQPADLRTAVAAGEVEIAVLPEPMVTIARSSNENLVVALDLTAEWDGAISEGSLVQGCVVARTEFIEKYPHLIGKFLTEYEASIAFLSEDTAAAAQMIVDAGIFAAAPVAQKAIPNCNICFVTGEEMKTAMNAFCEVMFAFKAESVGGAVPADNFYYIP